MAIREYDLGIVGDGQLGMMLTEAAHRLGLLVVVLGPGGENSPAAKMAGADWIQGGLRDFKALQELVQRSSVVTAEIEHFDYHTVDSTAEMLGKRMSPDFETFDNIGDKHKQHWLLDRLGVPVAPFSEANNAIEVRNALEEFPEGIVLKAKKNAYDGRGNVLVTEEDQIEEAIAELRKDDPTRGLYVEKRIALEKELSMIVAKNRNGAVAKYPLTETVHLRDQLRATYTPAVVDKDIIAQANLIADTVATEFYQGAGVMGIEMFLTKDGIVLANEIAPRVHNSGHWTIEGAMTSQFENHVRAVMGMPLGSTEMKFPFVGMVNIIGNYEGVGSALSLPNVFDHLYGKTERPERKLGHVTVVGDNEYQFKQQMVQLNSFLTQ